MKVKSESEVAQSCPTLSDHMDRSPPGSSIHGIFQASVLEGVPMQDMQVLFLHQEDPLEKEKATRSSILSWKISWTEEPGGLQSMGSQRVGQD